MANVFSSLAKRLKVTLPTITPAPGNVKPQEIQRSQAFFWQQFLKDQPIAYIDIAHRIQYYLANSSYLKMFMALKMSIYHWGFQVRADDPKDQKKLDAWFEEDVKPVFGELFLEDMGTREMIKVEASESNRERVNKFCRDAFQKFLEYDTVVSLWIDGRDYALLRPLEYFLYSDVMGIETMKYTHMLSVPQIDTLPPEQRERFISHPWVFLNPKYGEHWKLAKRSPVGEPFGLPWLMPAFMILGEEESKSIGMHELGWMMRNVTRLHSLGHEIKNGPLAGRPVYEWTEEKSQAVMSAWKDVIGSNDITANYDYIQSFPWPELEKFDETAWEGSHFRLNRFFGPLAHMIYAKGVTPYLSRQLQALATFDRNEFMRPFLTYTITKAYKPPVKIRVLWQDDIFETSQLTNEMRKLACQQGLVSPQTFQQWIGLDHDEEVEMKLDAAAHEKMQEAYMPIYDASHGSSPVADGPTDTNAPPAGAAGKGPKPGSKSGNKKGTKHKK